MTPKKKLAPKHITRKRASTAATAQVTVLCWEDDPGDPKSQPVLVPITVVTPKESAAPLPFKIKGVSPTPEVYDVGSAGFRYYAAASALRRTADFWGGILPTGTTWQVGRTLNVDLDSGTELNAFYTRGAGGDTPGLHFFHESVRGRVFYSGESPDVVCHEMGHAVLDALRPELFNAQFIEAAAFHESFGDMSALLSALQVRSFRQILFTETSGKINRASRLSRLAEQLGAAIRVNHPDAVDPDCLRNANNSFFYKDPQGLPPNAPASQLSSEPHSFSRVFTGAFLDALAGIFTLQGKSPTSDALVGASQDLAHILTDGIQAAPVVPEYFSQVAAHVVQAGEGSPFNGKYRDVLKSAFIRKGILSLQAATTLGSLKRQTLRAGIVSAQGFTSRTGELPVASIPATQFGLKKATLNVHATAEPKQFGVTASSQIAGPLEPPSAQNAAQIYTEDIFKRGHVDLGRHAHPESGVAHNFSFKTHLIVEKNGELFMQRLTFDCGFGTERSRGAF
jgi:hypothetical protein